MGVCHPEDGISGPRVMVRKAGGILSTKDVEVMGGHGGCG